jgi:Flp pilus assembly protein TadG
MSVTRLGLKRRRCGDRRRRQRGAALVEVAVAVILLCFIALGTADFGRVSYMAMALTNAARAGAIYGTQSLAKSSDFAGMETAAARSAAADVGVINTSASRTCECQVGSGTPTVMGSCPPIGTCTGTVRIRVKVIASKTFNMIKAFPGLPGTVSLSRTAIMRAQ